MSLANPKAEASRDRALERSLGFTCCQPPFGVRAFYLQQSEADSRNPIEMTFSRPVDPKSLGIEPTVNECVGRHAKSSQRVMRRPAHRRSEAYAVTASAG